MAASNATMAPITASIVIAELSWKPRSQGDTISARPAPRLTHSSQTAKAASAAIDDTAMNIPMIDAVCHCAPAERPNSHGEKNRIMPRIKLATSPSFALDQSSMTASVPPAHQEAGPLDCAASACVALLAWPLTGCVVRQTTYGPRGSG